MFADIGSANGGVCNVSDFLCFLDGTTAAATYDEVLNLWIFVVLADALMLSNVVVCCITGFFIFALELFVFLAKCDIISAVSTSLWNVDLEKISYDAFETS